MTDDINISSTNLILSKDRHYKLIDIVRLINISLKFRIQELDMLQANMQNELNDIIDIYVTAFVNPWDDTVNFDEGPTPAMFALSNGHYNIVQWLESKKFAKRHKEIFEKQTKFTKMDEEFARYYIDPGNYNKYWGEQSNDLS